MIYPTTEFIALASETRSQILQRLETRELTVGEIADGLPVSRPAISQHLRILEQAHLVSVEFRGTRHVYRIDPTGLRIVREWLDRFHSAAPEVEGTARATWSSPEATDQQAAQGA